MKRSLFALTASACLLATGGLQPALADQTKVEHYEYGAHLDIAKVISMEPVPTVCKVVPLHMLYEDSHGQQHMLEYEVMGNGCVD